MDKIAVIIPCYNEEMTIEKVVRDYQTVLPEATVYVYDNNSTDSSAEIARKAGAIVRYERRQGKGNVIRSMFREVDAECYYMVDADDAVSADNARSLCDLIINNGVDMVIGDRLSSNYFTENKRRFHGIGNKLVRFLINKLFHSNLHDILSGTRAFSRYFVKGFPVLSGGFEIETEMTIHALDKNYVIEEIPVLFRDRPEGNKSKLNTFSDGFKVLKTIARLFEQYKPFSFFGIISVLLWIVSLAFFIPVFTEYLHTGLVPRYPTLIVCGVTAIMGMLLIICGIILDVVVKKHRQMYEMMINHFYSEKDIKE